MIDTSRISSGFDVELQLGGDWFATAVRGLVDNGVITPPPPFQPDAEIVVDGVRVLGDDPTDDLELLLVVAGFQVNLLASLALSDAGDELVISSPGADDIVVPFGVLAGLAGIPVLTKAAGDNGTRDAIIVLANLDLRASDQDGDPLPEGEHLERGDATLATSFLPEDQHIAIGLGSSTFQRIANDVWHVHLTGDGGEQPLPDADNPIGEWNVVTMTPQPGRLRLRLSGVVPIDLWPDADVDITIDISITTTNGRLVMEMEVDSDVDTGILGDIFAFVVGGLIGLLIGAIFGPGLIVAGLVGAGLGVVVLEVGEAIVGGIITRGITARLDGEVISVLACDGDSIVSAVAPTSGGLGLAMLDAIPRSIPIFTEQPDPLHERHLLVTTVYDDVTIDAGGFAAAGTSEITERLQPRPVRLVDRVRAVGPDGEEGALTDLVYEIDGVTETVPVADAITRVAEGDLAARPLRLAELADGATTTLLDGTLASMCLHPDAIRRADTVVTDIRFTTGLDLRVAEAVELQEAGVIVLPGLQLIRPSGANPYFRSPPNDTTADNFENLPRF